MGNLALPPGTISIVRRRGLGAEFCRGPLLLRRRSSSDGDRRGIWTRRTRTTENRQHSTVVTSSTCPSPSTAVIIHRPCIPVDWDSRGCIPITIHSSCAVPVCTPHPLSRCARLFHPRRGALPQTASSLRVPLVLFQSSVAFMLFML